MKIFELTHDIDHLFDMTHDVSLIPFQNQESIRHRIIAGETIEVQGPYYFVANFNVLNVGWDYPVSDWDVQLMSSKMIRTLKSLGTFNHKLFSTVFIDDTFLEEKFQQDGSLLPNVPMIETYSIVQLLDSLNVFDFENSIYKPLRSNPEYPGIIKKLVVKKPENGFPPIFRITVKPSSVYISEQAKVKLEESGIQGCVYKEVEVSE